MTEKPEPIRKSLLPCIPPSEWEFSTVLGAPAGCTLWPGQLTGPKAIVVRRRISYGDWEPVTPKHWADEEPTDAKAGPAPAGTVDNPDPLREQIAAAIARHDYEIGLGSTTEVREHHRGQADAVLAYPAIQQTQADLARCRDRFATQAENGAALALELGSTEAALARVLGLLGEAVGWIHEGELRERICDALNGREESPPANPPGSTREQLPGHILALLNLPDYASTACQAALACEQAAEAHRDERPWLHAHAEQLHDRCRLNHKFTGQPCACRCHQDPS